MKARAMLARRLMNHLPDRLTGHKNWDGRGTSRRVAEVVASRVMTLRDCVLYRSLAGPQTADAIAKSIGDPRPRSGPASPSSGPRGCWRRPQVVEVKLLLADPPASGGTNTWTPTEKGSSFRREMSLAVIETLQAARAAIAAG